MLLLEEQTKPFDTAWRPARVLKVVDGDTCDLLVDLGFYIHHKIRVRLLHLAGLEDRSQGFNAWETRGKERARGLDAKATALSRIPEGNPVRVLIRKSGPRDKYGRWLAVIAYQDGARWVSLADIQLNDGLGRIQKIGEMAGGG
jgi:endonuclease YncB( thermonuclease family)